MIGATNLFIYILRYPRLPTVRSDIALLDIFAGHCGRLELITDLEMSFSFPRELAMLARHAISRSPTPPPGGEEGTGAGPFDEEIMETSLDVSRPRSCLKELDLIQISERICRLSRTHAGRLGCFHSYLFGSHGQLRRPNVMRYMGL